jgi:cell division transport system ATP-binding protein
VIRFESVSKRYPGGIDGLVEVSFEIRDGELVVLRGHSGAGKSTLLRLISAIERPTGGRVLVNDLDVGKLRSAAIPYLRRSLGLVTQDSRLLLDRTVFDNVMLPLVIAGLPRREAERRAATALERVGLAQHAQAMPVTLSGGEQQRAAIARAIVNRPAILIADEPTANLDADYAEEIAALFRSFNEAGVTVIVATHDDRLFASRTPRRLVLSHGRLLP